MQRLDAALKNFWRASNLLDSGDGQTGMLQCARGTAAGNEFDRMLVQAARKLHKTRLIRHRQQGFHRAKEYTIGVFCNTHSDAIRA